MGLAMLSARNLTLRRGPEPLLEQVNFTIFRGQKVGLTGANGTGKSSLIAAIQGELHADHGDIDKPAGLSIAHVEQEIAASARAALEFVLDGDAELRACLAAIDDAGLRDASMELAELHARLEAIGGYSARARAAKLMHGLGFTAADLTRPVEEFSGGWRVRLAMARALGSRADLLLLDEPTNHLDLDAILWLEDWLADFPGTLLLISHDREFLDRVIDRVLHIENRTIRSYSGNYSAFEEKRAQELTQQRTLELRQQRRVARITAFVNRFRATATKSRQAQSRLKMLARMERIVPAHVDSQFEFEFAPPLKTPRPLLTIEHGACGYQGRAVIGRVNVSIGPHDRIALLGPNGAGKSTLTRMLAGVADGGAVLGAGKRIAAPDLAVGYFAQHQLEQLNPACDAFWHVRNMGGPDFAGGDDERVRAHLGGFGFSGDRAFEPVARFSGGEKARLTLALLVARRPNLLLLDEPTNHLDIEMRHALTVALQGFEGGLVVVSHDRHLINAVADTLWLVADGTLRTFDGDLDDYQSWLRDRSKARHAAQAGPSGAERRPQDDLYRLRRELEHIERKIASITAQQASLDAEGESGASARIAARRTRLARDLGEFEERWMQIGEAIEEAQTKESGLP
jgi:ATP-binding cassette subfamily F protein 3